MQVRDVMTNNPLSVPLETTLAQAWEALQSLEVRHLPVINEDRELVGIVSDRDFETPPLPSEAAKLLGPRTRSPSASVATIMTGDPIAVEEDDDVNDVISLMLENKIGAVPVTTPEGQVVGIVSYLDLLRELGSGLS